MHTIPLALFLSVLITSSIAAQAERYDHDSDGYTVTFPPKAWKPSPGRDETMPSNVFINDGDRNGYLIVRKETFDQDTTLTEAVRRETDLKLRYLPGFVAGKEGPFSNKISGPVYTYEFIRAGKPMEDRIYFLKSMPARTTGSISPVAPSRCLESALRQTISHRVFG